MKWLSSSSYRAGLSDYHSILVCGNHLIVIMNKSHIAMVLIHDDNLVCLDVLATVFVSIMVIIFSARCIDRACSGFFAKDSAGSAR
jgi:hypothetical protein